MAAPTVVVTGSENGSDVETFAAASGSPVEGETVAIFVTLDGNPTDIASAGFTTRFSGASGTGGTGAVLVKENVPAGEPSTYTVTWTGAQKGTFFVVRSAHPDGAPLFDVVGTQTTFSNPQTAGAICSTITVADNSLAFAFYYCGRDSIVSENTGYQSGYTGGGNLEQGVAGGTCGGVSYKAFTTGAATGAATFGLGNFNKTGDGAGAHISFKAPAAAAAGAAPALLIAL